MDLEAILKQLREERDQLAVGIQALERVVAGQRRWRGRPLKWLAKAKTGPKRPRHHVDTSAAKKGE